MESGSANAKATKIWTVSELNRMLKELLEQTFYPFWISGEVSNLVLHRSGHVYFTLKDRNSQVPAVFFRGAQTARDLGLAEGMEIDLLARLTVYEPRGNYQLLVDKIRLKGVGELQKRFEELKLKLRTEGLFDTERKRPIPGLPARIGVVTSPEGAAIRDFLQILERRFANVTVRIYPAAVQGPKAAAEIAAGIQYLNDQSACDVIVVTRGGGSLEDLWPFNEERVARAVAASAIPVISAVGHEVDYTICDFVADLRVPTPSAAAELVIGKKSELLEQVAHLRGRLNSSVSLRMSTLRRRLDRAAGSPVFHEPQALVRLHQQRLDELTMRLTRALTQRHKDARTRLERLTGQLAVLNPRNVLERGYAILIDRTSKQALQNADAVAPGARLQGLLARGELELMVTGVKKS